MIELNPKFWISGKQEDSHNSFSMQQVFGLIIGQQREQVIHALGSFLQRRD